MITGADTGTPLPHADPGTPLPHADADSGTPLPHADADSGRPLRHADADPGTPLPHADADPGTPLPHADADSGTPLRHADADSGTPLRHADAGTPLRHADADADTGTPLPRAGRRELLHRLTTALHAQIPMTAYLRVAVAELEPDRSVVAAPLAPSHNHRGSAFGPAVIAVAGLAPWLLLVRRTWAERLAVHILLGRCEFAIHRPITGDYRACCDRLPPLDGEALRRGARVRLSASARVELADGAPAASYTAHYTVVPAPAGAGDGDLQLPFPEEWRA